MCHPDSKTSKEHQWLYKIAQNCTILQFVCNIAYHRREYTPVQYQLNAKWLRTNDSKLDHLTVIAFHLIYYIKNTGPKDGTQFYISQYTFHYRYLNLLFFSIHCMSTYIFDDRLNPPRHGGCQGCTHFWRAVLSFFKRSAFAFLFKIPQRCSIGYKSEHVPGQVIIFLFLFV